MQTWILDQLHRPSASASCSTPNTTSPMPRITASVCSALCFAAFAYQLHKKNVSIAIVSIGVDYFQILSIFASTNVAWPSTLQRVYAALSLFSFNLLNIFPPECSVAVEYETQWFGVMPWPAREPNVGAGAGAADPNVGAGAGAAAPNVGAAAGAADPNAGAAAPNVGAGAAELEAAGAAGFLQAAQAVPVAPRGAARRGRPAPACRALALHGQRRARRPCAAHAYAAARTAAWLRQ